MRSLDNFIGFVLIVTASCSNPLTLGGSNNRGAGWANANSRPLAAHSADPARLPRELSLKTDLPSPTVARPTAKELIVRFEERKRILNYKENPASYNSPSIFLITLFSYKISIGISNEGRGVLAFCQEEFLP